MVLATGLQLDRLTFTRPVGKAEAPALLRTLAGAGYGGRSSRAAPGAVLSSDRPSTSCWARTALMASRAGGWRTKASSAAVPWTTAAAHYPDVKASGTHQLFGRPLGRLTWPCCFIPERGCPIRQRAVATTSPAEGRAQFCCDVC